MQQKQLIAIILVIAVVAAAAVGAVLLLKGGSSGDTKYTVTYNTNGGNEIAAKEFTKNTDTFDLATPTKDGSTFLGWYLNADFSGDKITQVAKGTEKNITVYAKWQLDLANNTLPSAAQITANTDVKVTFDSGATDKTIPAAAVDELKAGKTLEVEDTVNKLTWTMSGSDSKQTGYADQAMDTTVTPDTSLLASEKKITLDFAYDGTLPYESTIRYFIGTDVFPAGTLISIQNSGDAEPIGQFPVDTEGYVTFTITHCSDWVLTQYITLTLDGNGGTFTISEQTVATTTVGGNYNSDVPVLPVPSRTGYGFDPWVSPVKFTEDATLTAQWTAYTYQVVFNKNSDAATGTMAAQDMTYDTEAALIANAFSNDGYSFAGWATTADGAVVYTDGQTVRNLTDVKEGTVNLYAKWTVNQYNAVVAIGSDATRTNLPAGWINNNDGSFTKAFDYGTAGADIIADFGSTAENTTKTGATFNRIEYQQPTMGTQGMFLAAFWDANTYSVHFNANGGNGSMDNQVFEYGTAQNLTANGFTNDTAAFNGWATTATGDVVYADQASVNNLTAVNNAVIDLYAIWGPYNIVVNITLDGSAYTDLTVTAKKDNAGDSLTLAYEGNGSYACRSGIELSSSYTVYVGNDVVGTVATNAQGSGSSNVAYFTVSFDSNGGVPTGASAIVLSGSTVDEPQDVFEKTGNELTGWKKGNADWNFSTAITETTTLVAQWTPVTYTVTLNTNGGVIASGNITQYTYGVGATLPTDIGLLGHNFLGWYANPNFGGDAILAIGLTETGDKAFYAKWATNTYTVTFDGNGAASGSVANISATYDVEFAIPANGFTKTGSHFTGWNTAVDGSGTPYQPAANVSNLTAENGAVVTLYAQWSANTYTVVFNKNSETATGTMSPQQFTYGADPVALTANAFSNVGFAMSGWATSADGNKAYDDGELVRNLSAEDGATVNLYAIWESFYIQVTIKVNDLLDTTEYDNVKATHNAMEYPMTRISPGVYKVSSTPNMSIQEVGYTIYIGNQAVANTTVTQGKAEVEVNYYTVTFDTRCELDNIVQKVLRGELAEVPAVLERVGYTFDCWSEDSTQRVPFDFEHTIIGSARVLDAFWNAETYTVVYNSNGGSGSMNNGSATFGIDFTAAACTFTKTEQDTEYRFIGWNTQANGQGVSFFPGTPKAIDAAAVANLSEGNIVLYAQWIDGSYMAQVGDTFTGKYTYLSPDPNHNFSNLDTVCTVISVGEREYRMEVQLIDGIYTTTMVVADYTNGGWPIFGEYFQDIDLAAILATPGTPGTQSINGQTAAVTQYSFTLCEGLADGTLRIVDETGMICYISMTMTLTSEQASHMDGMLSGTYTETIQIDAFETAVQGSSHEVQYYMERYSEEPVTRTSGEYLTPDALGFHKDDKVFVEWRMGSGYDYEVYHPGERIMGDRSVYGVWETPNTNITWAVVNLPAGMDILLNGDSDAWVSDAQLNDVLTMPGTSNWSFSNNAYHFTFQQKTYTLEVYTTVTDPQTYDIYQAANPILNQQGEFSMVFNQVNANNKFYVNIRFYEPTPDAKGYNAKVGDSFTYSAGGYDTTFTVTKVPGSEGWASETTYQYTSTTIVQGQEIVNTSTQSVYLFPLLNMPVGTAVLVTEETYMFNGQSVDCYVLRTTSITQGNGSRSVHTDAEYYIGIADGIVYSSVISYGSTDYELRAKSNNIESVSAHEVTFHGNGGLFNSDESRTEKVYGTNDLDVMPRYEGRRLTGWSTTQGGAVAYSTHQVIPSAMELWAVWAYDGSFAIINPGNGSSPLPAGQLTVPITTDSSTTKVYPFDYRCVTNTQVGATFTIGGFTPFGDYQSSPVFKYVQIRITDNVPGADQYWQIAENAWVSKSQVENTAISSQFYPVETWQILLLRNNALNLDVGYAAPVAVSFDPNGAPGSTIQVQAPQNGYVSMPPMDTFTRSGYMFIGWMGPNYSIYGHNPVLDDLSNSERSALAPNLKDSNYCQIGTEPYTFTAIWEKVVTIQYNANGGEFEEGIRTTSMVKVTDANATKALLGGYLYPDDLYEEDLHKNGYKLLGWATSANATTLTYLPGDEAVFTPADGGRTVRLYAIWAADDQVFQITYDQNTELQSLIWNFEDRVYFLAAGITSPVANAGYSFGQSALTLGIVSSWTTAPNGSGERFDTDGIFLFDSKVNNFVLYAQWKTTATVTFLPGEGATGSMNPQEVPFKSATTLNNCAFTKEGCAFAGWALTPEMPITDAVVNGNLIIVYKAIPSLTLTATWATVYTVTFSPNGGEFAEEFNTVQNVTDGSILSVPSINKENYEFGGWVLEDDTVVDFATTPITESFAVSAKWVFTVYYHQWAEVDDYWDWVENEQLRNTAATGNVALPQCEARANYNVYWSTTPNGENAVLYTPNTMQALTPDGGSIALYELYVGYPFTVHYNADGAEGEFPDQVFHYGDEEMRLYVNNPEIDGMEFLGWFANGDDTAYQYGNDISGLYVANGEITLTAHYQPYE